MFPLATSTRSTATTSSMRTCSPPSRTACCRRLFYGLRRRGDDTIISGAAGDILAGGSGNDTIIAAAAGITSTATRHQRRRHHACPHSRADGGQFRCVNSTAVRRQRPDLRRRPGLDGSRLFWRLQRRDFRRPGDIGQATTGAIPPSRSRWYRNASRPRCWRARSSTSRGRTRQRHDLRQWRRRRADRQRRRRRDRRAATAMIFGDNVSLGRGSIWATSRTDGSETLTGTQSTAPSHHCGRGS